MEKEKVESDSMWKKNQGFVDRIIEEYPKFFEVFNLDETTDVAILSNNRKVEEEDREILPPFDYMVASKYGLTLFNCSYSPLPLEWERTQKTIRYLIANSHGEFIEDILISHWKPFLRNRKMKGLLKLKKTINSVLVDGIHLEEGLKDFYNLILKETLLNQY